VGPVSSVEGVAATGVTCGTLSVGADSSSDSAAFGVPGGVAPTACCGNPSAPASASTCSVTDENRLPGPLSHERSSHASNPGPSFDPRSDAGTIFSVSSCASSCARLPGLQYIR